MKTIRNNVLTWDGACRQIDVGELKGFCLVLPCRSLSQCDVECVLGLDSGFRNCPGLSISNKPD